MREYEFDLLYSLIKQYEPKRRKFGRPRKDDRELLKGFCGY